MKPALSVVCTTFNCGPKTRTSLLALLSQTFADWNCFIVDDGSDEQNREYLRGMLADFGDGRFSLVQHEQNQGLTAALITGFKSCDADYVAIQESGDISLPDRLGEQFRFLHTHQELGAVGCHFVNVTPDGGRRIMRPGREGCRFERMLKANQFAGGELMFRREAYSRVGGYRGPMRRSQDYDLTLRLAKMGALGVVETQLYERHIDFGGISFSPDKYVDQALYVMAARRLAVMEPGEAGRALEVIGREGVQALVRAGDRDVQRRIWRGVVRSAVLGDGIGAKGIAAHLERPLARLAGIALAHTAPIAPVLRKGLLGW